MEEAEKRGERARYERTCVKFQSPEERESERGERKKKARHRVAVESITCN